MFPDVLYLWRFRFVYFVVRSRMAQNCKSDSPTFLPCFFPFFRFFFPYSNSPGVAGLKSLRKGLKSWVILLVAQKGSAVRGASLVAILVLSRTSNSGPAEHENGLLTFLPLQFPALEVGTCLEETGGRHGP
jgi:hypothetical protein